MKIDPFVAGLGIASIEGDDLPEEISDLLGNAVEAFLRAGGVLSWNDWERMSAETRAAFVAAGDRLRSEKAGLAGLAAQSPQAAAGILSASDGGDLSARLAISAACDRLAEKVDGRKFK
jgi:hypothetical protein